MVPIDGSDVNLHLDSGQAKRQLVREFLVNRPDCATMEHYFELRGVSQADYENYKVPPWLWDELRSLELNAKILDFGCGFGQLIRELQSLGYCHVEGADIEPASIAHCKANGWTVHDLTKESNFFLLNRETYDLVITSHVLEHISKPDVISTLEDLRKLLSPIGYLVVAVPNAQAFTGPYWAYEDFTHHTVYTSGSLHYILRAAGFRFIRFVDIDCTAGLPPHKAVVRKLIWRLYNEYYKTMCKLLGSPTHPHSPAAYSYEIKAIAR